MPDQPSCHGTYLNSPTHSLIPLDTTTVDKGTFIFRGSQEGYAPRYIQVKHKAKDTKDSFASLVLENADFDVHIYPAESKQKAKVNVGPSHSCQRPCKAGRHHRGEESQR